MSQSLPPLEEPIEEDHGQIPHQQQSYPLNSINSAILIRQLPSEGIAFQLWPAAAALVSLLDRHRRCEPSPISSLFNSGVASSRRLHLLELGSGTGLVGIAAAALLGARVTVTDLPNVLPNLQFNLDANAAMLEIHGGDVRVAALSWGDPQQMEGIGRDYDMIVGTDVVYHQHLYEPLIQTLRYFLLGSSERKVVFLMAHLKRWKKESIFFKKAKKLFDVEVIFADSPSNGSRVGVTVYTFVRRNCESLKQ